MTPFCEAQLWELTSNKWFECCEHQAERVWSLICQQMPLHTLLPVLRICSHIFQSLLKLEFFYWNLGRQHMICHGLPDYKISTEPCSRLSCQLIPIDLLLHIDQSNNETLPPWNSIRTIHTEKYIHQLELEGGSLTKDWVVSYILSVETWSKAPTYLVCWLIFWER